MAGVFCFGFLLLIQRYMIKHKKKESELSFISFFQATRYEWCIFDE